MPDTFSATEERLQFLLNLEEALRKVPSAEAITALAAELLGQHLQAGRAGFGDVVENGQVIRVEQDWAGTMDSLAGKARVFDALGPAIIALLRNGKMLVVESCDNDPRIEPEHLQAWRSIGTKALIIAPLVRDRQLAGVFYVHSAVPRLWTPAEVTLVRDVAARTWSAYAQFKVEAALRASEDRLRDITDALPILIAYLDKDQVFRFVNKPYEKWFGRPIHQILGHHLSELMAPEVYEARRPYVERALAGEQVQYDIDMPRPDEPVTTQILHVPHRDESGTVQGLYALVQDITARKRNEMALAESENRFRQLAELSPAFIWSADVDGGVTYISQRWHDFLGREQSNPFTADDDALHPDDRIVVGRAWQHSLATGEPLWIQARFRRHDGDFVWHSVRAEPSRNPAGVITGWLGATTDIHASVVHAQERQRDHDRLWNISQELMLVRDGTGTILSVNPTATRLLGWKPADMVGKSVFDFMHPDDQTRTADYVARQSVTDDVIAIQNRYRAADGSYRLFDWRGVTENGVVHAVGRDITAEHQAAQELLSAEEALRQAQKMEAIGQLTGGIAHDFNNMLAGIIGSLDVIQRRIAAGRFDDLARFINGAITSSKRAASLTQRLLAFGRRQALDIRPVEVGQLVSSLHDLLRRTLGEAITIQAIVPPTSCWAQADAAQLESAILNLAINARDAMPSGGDIRLNVQSRTIAADTARLKRGEYIAVTVSDTGSGMPPEVMAKAFDPFFTTKPIGQGTGLGLSMIHGFMGQIGGDVTIDSAPGQGTTVTMFLPQARHADTPQASSPAFQPSKSLASGTVLVVEDDPAVSMLVVSLLDELGLKSVVAVDGNAGLSILQSAIRVDLLISDVGLPGLDGRQLAEHARQVRPFLKVLFLTGYAEGAALRAADLQPGMRLMTKPFEMAALGQMIQDMLSSDPPPLGS